MTKQILQPTGPKTHKACEATLILSNGEIAVVVGEAEVGAVVVGAKVFGERVALAANGLCVGALVGGVGDDVDAGELDVGDEDAFIDCYRDLHA